MRENKIFYFSSCVFGLRKRKLFYKFTIMSPLDKTKKLTHFLLKKLCMKHKYFKKKILNEHKLKEDEHLKKKKKARERTTGKDQKKKTKNKKEEEKKNRKIIPKGRYFLITKKKKREKKDRSSTTVQRTGPKIGVKIKKKTEPNWRRNENPCALAHVFFNLLRLCLNWLKNVSGNHFL